MINTESFPKFIIVKVKNARDLKSFQIHTKIGNAYVPDSNVLYTIDEAYVAITRRYQTSLRVTDEELAKVFGPYA